MGIRILPFLLVLAACAAPATPPESYQIDPKFSTDQANDIRLAFSAWCEQVSYCPVEVPWETDHARADWAGKVFLADGYWFENLTDDTAAFNRDPYIAFRLGHPELPHYDNFLRTAMHEIGHYCIAGHTSDGTLMAEQTYTVEMANPLEIDREALDAWEDGCGH